jgi:hypothetical protein
MQRRWVWSVVWAAARARVEETPSEPEFSGGDRKMRMKMSKRGR